VYGRTPLADKVIATRSANYSNVSVASTTLLSLYLFLSTLLLFVSVAASMYTATIASSGGGRISDAVPASASTSETFLSWQGLTDTQQFKKMACGMSIGVEGLEDRITSFVCSTPKKSLRIVSLGIKAKIRNDDGTHSDVVVGIPSDDPLSENLVSVSKDEAQGYVVALVKDDYPTIDAFVSGETISHAQATAEYAFLLPFWNKDNIDMKLVAVKKILPIPQGHRPPSGRQFDTNENILSDIGPEYASWMSILFEEFDPALMSLLMMDEHQTDLGSHFPSHTTSRGRSLVNSYAVTTEDVDVDTEQALSGSINKLRKIAGQLAAANAAKVAASSTSYTIPRTIPARDANDDDQTLGVASVSPGSRPPQAELRKIRLRLLGMCLSKDGVVYLPELSEEIKVCVSIV
jgi:hypothetical protein